VLLIISAYSLFLFTAVAGRLWCGYACPQTVYTEIFMWIERKVEGDRPARMKLDAAPLDRPSSLRKGPSTASGSLSPVDRLHVRRLLHADPVPGGFVSAGAGPWETFWIFFYGFATYGNAGFMREQVCKYMCPYARFQGVDVRPGHADHHLRPRARRAARGALEEGRPEGARLGACVDCNICVQVCPTGIDIRNGLQYECIGCAACIDGLRPGHGQDGLPRGLIR
jgi:cytochrome c oxidase accessory protein FixG